MRYSYIVLVTYYDQCGEHLAYLNAHTKRKDALVDAQKILDDWISDKTGSDCSLEIRRHTSGTKIYNRIYHTYGNDIVSEDTSS